MKLAIKTICFQYNLNRIGIFVSLPVLLSQSPNLGLTNDFEQVRKGCAEKHKETKIFSLNMVHLANMWLQIFTPKSSLVNA